MASSHVFVVDSAFKRTQIKVTPGKYMREILEEACKAKKLDPESYTLKTQNNKLVDLSQPFRLSGLTAGAKLQLTQASRSPSVVNVAIQLPESEGGGRLSDKFPSTTSLWLVLRKYEDAVAGQPPRKLNLTQRGAPPTVTSGAGRLEYEQPVLNLMGRNLDTFPDLQKSLAQLGINSGSVLIRLSFKSSGQPLDEAMREIDQYFSSVDDGSTSAVAGSSKGAQNDTISSNGATETQPNQRLDDTTTAMATSDVTDMKAEDPDISHAQALGAGTAPSSVEAEREHEPGQQSSAPAASEPPSNVVNGMSVFRPPSSSTPAAALQEDDPTNFEPSIEHAKAHQAVLQRATKNQRLPSDKELEDQENERRSQLALIQNVTIRIRYPDQSMIETTLQASDTSSDLYAKVMGTLANAPEPFELKYTGAKGHQTLPNSSNQRLVRDLGFRGKMLVTLVWSPDASLKARQSPSLKEEYRSKAQDLKVELATQQSRGAENHRAAMAKPDSSSQGGAAATAAKVKGDVEAKMKKFLGFGKK